MKRRIALLGITITMSLIALTGCGNADKKNYISDIKAIVDTNDKLDSDDFSDLEEIKKAQDVVDDMKVKTDEGKEIKNDFKNLFKLLEDVYSLSDAEDVDDETLTELDNKYDEIEEKLDKDADTFIKAAEDAGVDDKDIDELSSAI